MSEGLDKVADRAARTTAHSLCRSLREELGSLDRAGR
jgi:hypothetical protein